MPRSTHRSPPGLQEASQELPRAPRALRSSHALIRAPKGPVKAPRSSTRPLLGPGGPRRLSESPEGAGVPPGPARAPGGHPRPQGTPRTTRGTPGHTGNPPGQPRDAERRPRPLGDPLSPLRDARGLHGPPASPGSLFPPSKPSQSRTVRPIKWQNRNPTKARARLAQERQAKGRPSKRPSLTKASPLKPHRKCYRSRQQYTRYLNILLYILNQQVHTHTLTPDSFNL